MYVLDAVPILVSTPCSRSTSAPADCSTLDLRLVLRYLPSRALPSCQEGSPNRWYIRACKGPPPILLLWTPQVSPSPLLLAMSFQLTVSRLGCHDVNLRTRFPWALCPSQTLRLCRLVSDSFFPCFLHMGVTHSDFYQHCILTSHPSSHA